NGANPKAGGSNWPLRGNKGSVWEGGIRSVGFVNSFFFDKNRRGSVTNELIHVTDWFPTLINVADGNLKGTQYLDGHDQWKTIRYGIPSTRTEILHGIETVDKSSNRAVFESIFNTSRTASLRVGIWKILTGLQGSSSRRNKSSLLANVRLFDIKNDPQERTDIAPLFPDIVTNMLQRLERYQRRMVSCHNPEIDPLANPKYHNGFWQPWQ
ncbi:arylsulfatase J-like, partial [Mercenaria mercenaria]|uniref:arylsulfatase J-like n=1 Tax=Mercenaria mercenaria TaxID=6596 RepID=UPI00234F2A9D